MKVFLIFVLTIHLTCAYVFDTVPEVTGITRRVGFDSDGNIYAITNDALFKLSPKGELVSTVKLPDNYINSNLIQISARGNVYFIISNDNIHNYTIGVVRSKSDTVEIVDSTFGASFLYTDPYDNLYYSKESGIHMLRPASKTPILIKNMDGLRLYGTKTATVDQEGNIYFTGGDALFLLTKEELQKKVPEAKKIKVLGNMEGTISYMVVDEKNNVWVIADAGFDGLIKKLANGEVATINIDDNHSDLIVTATKDRIWVVARDSHRNVNSSIYYITLFDEIVDIPDLQNLTQQQYSNSVESLADKDGTAYFMTAETFTPELGQIIIINPGESKPVPVTFAPKHKNNIKHIFMDINEAVWVFTDYSTDEPSAFLIEKGQSTAKAIEDFDNTCDGVHSNPVTHDIVLSCYSELVIAKNEMSRSSLSLVLMILFCVTISWA